MKETAKSLAHTSQVNAALDTAFTSRDKITKLQTFESSYFIGRTYFDDEGSEN